MPSETVTTSPALPDKTAVIQGLLSRLDPEKIVMMLTEWLTSQEEFQGNVRDALKAIYRQNQRLEEEIRALRRP